MSNSLRLFLAAGALCSVTATAAFCAEQKSITFENLTLPRTDEEKTGYRVSPKAVVNYSNGTAQEFALSYKVLMRSGEKDPNGSIFGLLHDRDGGIIKTPFNPDWVSVTPDADSYFRRDGRNFLLTHLEGIPGSIYLTEFRKEATGALRPVSFKDIDFSGMNGTVFNCAGSKTPWDTHLGGEEDYAFDAYYFDPATAGLGPVHASLCEDGAQDLLCLSLAEMKKYLKAGALSEINPYEYGHIVEISLDANAKPHPLRRYAMGKGTPELAYVMPDARTVYMTDDGPNAGLYMFVADKEKDLSSGTLYMARWNQKDQKDKKDTPGAELKWVRLGSSNDREIKAIIDRAPLLSDIFDVAGPVGCPQGFTLIKAGSPGLMCLRLRDGLNGSALSEKFSSAGEVKKAAAFLEMRKFGAYLGATAEFNKEEGLMYDPDRNVLYVAITSIEKSMEDNPSDPGNHIRLQKNRCGAVFEMKLEQAGDSTGSAIGSRYAGTEIRPIVTGRPLKEGEKGADENACDPDSISNPDNLGYYKNILFIGEDTAYHMNNMVWAYDLAQGTLTRIMTLPTGAEVTGTFHRAEIDDKSYIFINIQHPLRDPSINASGSTVNSKYLGAASSSDRNAYIGYIFGLPSAKASQ